MSERLHPALEQHKLFTYARLTAIGFLALSIVAFAVGLCGIHLFKEHVYERTAASSETSTTAAAPAETGSHNNSAASPTMEYHLYFP